MTTALFDLRREAHDRAFDRSSKVRVTLRTDRVFDLHGKLREIQRQSSMRSSPAHYVAAAILHDRALTLAQFEPARYDDPKLRRFAEEQVEVRLDPALSRRASVAVEIETADGSDAAGALRASARLVREPAFARADRGQVPCLCQGPDGGRPHRRGDRGGQSSWRIWHRCGADG